MCYQTKLWYIYARIHLCLCVNIEKLSCNLIKAFGNCNSTLEYLCVCV